MDSSTLPWRAQDHALWGVERIILRHYAPSALLAVALLIVNEVLGFGTNVRNWDWLFSTGVLTLVVAERIALGLPDHVHDALTRLATRNILQTDTESLTRFEERLHRSTRRSSLLWAVVVMVAVIVAWLAAKQQAIGAYAQTVTTEAAGAAIAGLFIGRAVGYGRLGKRISEANIALEVEPQDLDGAAGLRPIGQLFFFQAAVLAVPAAFLATWWYIIPLFGTRYADWRNPYTGLLALVGALEILAFIVPMLAFHGMMREQKRTLRHRADELSHEAAETRRALLSATGDERASLNDRLVWIDDRYRAIEAMPTWPVDVRLRRRFTVNNVFLLLPVVAQAVGLSDDWRNLLEGLRDALTSA